MRTAVLGSTDQTVLVFIPDPASTDGSGKTGLNAAALTVSYVRAETDNDVTVTDVTSSLSDLSALTDSHADWGLKEVSSTLAPGLYRLDLADAVFAAGATEAVVYVMITSSAAAASPIAFRLDGAAPGALTVTERTAIGDSLLKTDIDTVEGAAPVHSLTGAVLKLVSKVDDNGSGSLVTYKTNGSDVFANQAITTGASLEPIDALGVATAP